MKSEHRHELKTNELAEWLSNFPQWCRDNLGTIIGVVAIIVVAGVIYGWRYYSRNVVEVGEETEYTNQVGNLLNVQAQIMEQRMQGMGADLSDMFKKQSEELDKFTDGIKNDNIEAMALIKKADAIRAKMHYSSLTVSDDELNKQINEAMVLYEKAVKKSASDKTIRGLASLGLGLCAEEINDFDKAKKIYNELVNDSDFIGTVVIAKAQFRLDTMDDYRQDVVFQPMPEIIEPEFIPIEPNYVSDSNSPTIPNITLPESNLPMIDNIPMDLDLSSESTVSSEPNLLSDTDMPIEVNPEDLIRTDLNEPVIEGIESGVVSEDSDVNGSAE